MDYFNSEVIEAINEVCHSERDRMIMKRRLVDGVCFEPLAEESNLSVRQTKNIVYRCSEQVFKYMAHKKLRKAL